MAEHSATDIVDFGREKNGRIWCDKDENELSERSCVIWASPRFLNFLRKGTCQRSVAMGGNKHSPGLLQSKRKVSFSLTSLAFTVPPT